MPALLMLDYTLVDNDPWRVHRSLALCQYDPPMNLMTKNVTCKHFNFA